PFFVGQADDQRIFDGRVGFQNFFDFFRIDFLARRIDADRATAEQRQRAVWFDKAPVARDRVARAADRLEGLGALFRVLVVANRDGRTQRDEAGLARSGDDRLIILIEHLTTFADL